MNTDNKFWKSVTRLALITGLLLLIPLVAMQFTDEVVWTLSDFIFAGTILFTTGLTYILMVRKADNIIYRAAVGLALASALFLVWSNLAVGIIGSETNDANLMYFAVIYVLIIGALLARFRPQGMAFALLTTALAQALTIVIALIGGMQHYPGSSVYEIIMVNGFFITLFTISAGLFWYAAQETDESNAEPTVK